MMKWHHYDESERRKWQDPEKLLQDIGVQPGMTFMDIGCGPGFFSLPAGRLTGKTGKVYAVDFDEEAIATLRQRADREGLTNLEATVNPAEDALLCQGCADVVFMGIVLHDFKDPGRVLRNARQMLKRSGKLVDLDWKKVPMAWGPPLAKRFAEARASELIEGAGFKDITVQDYGEFNYLITARPI
jgi:ubiquinone/menaquinone biosynthesis C-methylase UbiE